MPRDSTSPQTPRPLLRRVLRAARWLPLVILIGLALVTASAWTATGRRAVGERLARMQRSPQWQREAGHFVNPQPLHNDNWAAMTAMFHASDDASPRQPIPVDPIDPGRFATAPASGLRVTWLGHAANLIEIDGARVLTDPVWSERASPLQWIGPQRWYRPPIALADLPALDAVVISHDHYDHLDMRHHRRAEGSPDDVSSCRSASARTSLTGAFPRSKIVELDWWERTKVGAIEIVCTPARHASGRNMLFDRDAKLWAGYAFIGPRHRVFFSGDTGLHPAMRDIGARLGPFDVTMIEVGQYHRAWPDWHIGPEQAVAAHAMLRGKVMLPMHWGLFTLAPHGWTEPIERAVAAGTAAGATLVTPKPGESIELEPPPARVRWWPSLPWVTAAEHPIVSTQMN